MKNMKIEEEAKEETQEYIHIGKRIHRLEILAQKCYDAVREFNKEMEDFSNQFPDLIAIDHSLRLKIEYTSPDDPDIKEE